MRILFVNTQLKTGGIATSLCNLCEQLKDYPNISIDIILLNQDVGDDRYKFSDNVNIKLINNKKWKLYTTPLRVIFKSRSISNIINACYIRVLSKLIGREKVIKMILKDDEVLKGYDVAISFRNDEYQYKPWNIVGCNDFVLQCVDANKKIAWIHNDPDRHGFTYKIAKRRFKNFDTIVNVSQGCKDRFDEIIPEYKYKSKLVYNTFNHDEIIKKSEKFNPYKNIEKDTVKLVTVGRIANEQKRMDRIVKICSELREKEIENYIWYIVGDGPDTYKLKSKVRELDLSNNIIFVGKQDNPFPYIKYSDCLVMTSEYEAYGMTLVEAITVNTPVITTNHIAAKEIVKDGINGFIAENSSDGILEKVRFVLEKRNILNELRTNIKNIEYNKNIAINQFLKVIDYK